MEIEKTELSIETIKTELSMVASVMSKFFIDLEKFLEGEEEKYKNGEQYDEYALKNSKLARMHASHSLGELIEAKSCITEDLTPIDRICMLQYENEMSQAIEAILNKKQIDDIFNED